MPWSPAPSSPASRAQPPGHTLQRTRLDHQTKSPPPLCSWAVCFQCPGIDFPPVMSSSSSCLYCPWGLWREVGRSAEGSEGLEAGLPVSCGSSKDGQPLEPVLDCSPRHREGRDSRREVALARAGVFSHLPPYTTTTEPATWVRELRESLPTHTFPRISSNSEELLASNSRSF